MEINMENNQNNQQKKNFNKKRHNRHFNKRKPKENNPNTLPENEVQEELDTFEAELEEDVQSLEFLEDMFDGDKEYPDTEDYYGDIDEVVYDQNSCKQRVALLEQARHHLPRHCTTLLDITHIGRRQRKVGNLRCRHHTRQQQQ